MRSSLMLKPCDCLLKVSLTNIFQKRYFIDGFLAYFIKRFRFYYFVA